MALTRTWYEDLPDDENFGYEIDDYMRQTRVDVRERLAVQHKAYADETGHTDVGEHTPGQCTIAFIGAKADFPTPPTTTAGCLAVATDEANQVYYWSGTAWTKLQEPVLITGNQTIAGAKTFSGAVTLGAVSTIKDGSVMSTSGAPTTDAMIANKKYVDDQLVAMSAYVTVDSDDNTLVKDHTYLAKSKGYVAAHIYGASAVASALRGYVGATLIAAERSDGAGDYISIFFAVGEGETFLIEGSLDAPVILWKSHGPLAKPEDQT